MSTLSTPNHDTSAGLLHADANDLRQSSFRVAFFLPGMGRVQRGAETAFIEVARALNFFDDVHVELFGSGDDVPAEMTSHTARCIPREWFEKFPSVPCFRNEYAYEEWTFVRSLNWRRLYKPEHFDVTVSCTYPHVNWFLQKKQRTDGGPISVFVTQNGDWMCQSNHREYRHFRCDGLVCINPDYYTRNRELYRTALIPNGVDPSFFVPTWERELEAPSDDLRIEHDGPVVLMASAMIESKRVADAVRAVGLVPNACLVVAGDGPQRQKVAELAREHLPGRHRLLGSVQREHMPYVFQQADAFLHMSQEEPFGIVYLEAASSGLPIVSHDSETAHWILADTALYANTSDLQQVADTLNEALTPATSDALGRAGRERVVAEWSWRVQAGRYRQFMRELLGREEN